MLDNLQLVARPEGVHNSFMGKSLVCLTAAKTDDRPHRTAALLANRPTLPAYSPAHWEARSFVYFITGSRGPVKIGVAVDPARRLQQLQVSSPKRLVVAAMVPGGFDQERYLHDFFKRERLSGEWFRRSQRLSAYLLSLMEPPPLNMRG